MDCVSLFFWTDHRTGPDRFDFFLSGPFEPNWTLARSTSARMGLPTSEIASAQQNTALSALFAAEFLRSARFFLMCTRPEVRALGQATNFVQNGSAQSPFPGGREERDADLGA